MYGFCADNDNDISLPCINIFLTDFLSNGPDSGNDAPPRRSLRKREDKSYAESPDLFIDDSALSPMRTDNGKQKSNSIEIIRSKDGGSGQRVPSANVSSAPLGEATVATCKGDADDDGKSLSIKNNHRNGGSHLNLDNLRKPNLKTGTASTEAVHETVAVGMNNGDVEMESENEEDEVSAPVGVMPEPKVQIHNEIDAITQHTTYKVISHPSHRKSILQADLFHKWQKVTLKWYLFGLWSAYFINEFTRVNHVTTALWIKLHRLSSAWR